MLFCSRLLLLLAVREYSMLKTVEQHSVAPLCVYLVDWSSIIRAQCNRD